MKPLQVSIFRIFENLITRYTIIEELVVKLDTPLKDLDRDQRSANSNTTNAKQTYKDVVRKKNSEK